MRIPFQLPLPVPEDGKLGLDVISEMTGVLVEPGYAEFTANRGRSPETR